MTKMPRLFAAHNATSSFDSSLFFAKVGHRRSIANYRKDQIVFSQEDPADAVCYIDKGMVMVTVHSKDGKRAVVAILAAGDFFGEECLATLPRRTATVTTMMDSSISRVEKAAMIHVLHSEPRVAESFISYLSARKIRVEDDLADQLLNSSEKRLARRLLLLTDPGQNKWPKAIVRMKQDTLAAMVGTTQARISFFMNKFRRCGFIEYNGDLKVHSGLSTILTD